MKGTNTVFKVSLPITKGAVLLERTSFSKDNHCMSGAYSPSFGPDHSPLPECQTKDFDTGTFSVCDPEHTSAYTASSFQQGLNNQDAGAGQYLRPEGNFTATQNQEVDGYFGHNVHFNQSDDTLGKRQQSVSGEMVYNRQHGYQERSSNNFNKDVKSEGPQTGSDKLSHLVSHTHDWSYYNPSYGCLESYAKNMYPHLGDAFAYSNHAAPEPEPQFHETQPRQLQAYMKLPTGYSPTAPESYMTQPVAYQAIKVGYGIMCDPNYNFGHGTNNYQHYPHPVSDGSVVGDMFYSNAYLPPSNVPWSSL